MRKLKLFSLFAAMLFATSTWAATVDLSNVTSDRTFQNGDVLQGTLFTKAKLSIAAGATVTLNGVNINWGGSLAGGDFAGLNCVGNATIILADGSVNYVKGFMDGPSGIHVAPNYTVTIQGNGTLNVATKGGGAAIGSGYSDQYGSRNAGNIVINGGTIYANGGNLGAGIGGGGRAKVGNITINGGIIFAVGGGTGAGIGGGQSKNSSWKSQVGNITISSSVRYLKATKGSGAAHSIGKGSSDYSVCGTVKVGNSTGAISTSPYVYCPPADNTKSLINAIGTVAHTEACKAKIDAARAAYDALEIQEMRDLVTNYSTLTAAEAAYNQLAANAVIDKINAIGLPITAADQTAIEDARAAYNALTDTQKGYVTNYSELTDAEAILAVVNLINAIGSPVTASSQTAIDAARNAYNALTGDQQALVGNYATLTDAEAALAVVNLINAIGSPITAASQTAIDAARNAYDALTNAQKSYVDNYATLTDAEAAYAALTPSADPTIFAGFTATAGCGGFGGEDHSKLVDGLFVPGNEGVNWTKWCADGQHKSVPSGESESCWWVDFNAANPIAVTGYILTTGNDNTQWGQGRNPNSWKIKAKLNAGDAWTTIATVTNDNTMQVADFTDFSFTLDQAGTYKYFRFMIYEPEYDNCMQLCELRFTGNGGSTPEPAYYALLLELYNALGNDVWTGYGVNTGVISYKQGTEPNSFNASFMGGTYSFDLPFEAFTSVSKADNGDGTYTYNLDVNLPAQTGLSHEVLHVTTNANGEITGIHSDVAQTDMNKVGGAIASWADLNAAMANGGVLQLSQSLTATNLDGALVVPAGKTVVLDLNGFSLDRHLTSAQADGCVIINNGTLAITDNVGGAEIKGGYNSGNGGGIVNNGIFTLYGGEITGNAAAIGGGVYNNGGAQGFWMTGGLIHGNTATTSHPAIGGEVIFNENAAVQIDAQGAQVTIAQALAGLETYSYIKPVMPNYDELETDYTLLLELYNALGNDVWTGYGVNTGVISYKQGTEPNSFNASFMGGTYSFDLPFEAFTSVSKADNGDGTHTYTLVVNLPAQTGMSQETLHVTMNANGEITEMDSENAGIELQKETDGTIATWADLQNALNQGGVIKLTNDIVGGDAPLEIPAGKTVVLDLNGHTIDRGMTDAAANGSVIVNNGTLAIMDEAGNGVITGGKTTGNGGGVLNNGIFTLYGGEITGNAAAIGGGVYNNGGAQGFWMTGGLIHDNTATSNPAIGGEVIFNENAAVQIDAQGAQVTIAQALAGLETYSYIKPVMPNYDELETDYTLLLELYNALGNDVWTGYGVNTGVISYKQGTEPNSFNASFMGGTYSFDLPFDAFTSVSKADNGDGTHTYTLVVNLPAQTGMSQETLHVTMNANGEITEMDSENAGIELQKETDGTIATWADLQNALNNGGVIKLTNDIVGGDAPLEIPAGKTVVLDLNGHTIDRGMTDAAANGSVIVNNGTLAIMDEAGNGVITGGKTTGNGGGVLNNGIFTLYGGEITGNAAALGGGVYNNGGEQGFWMTGGLIDGNTATTNPAIGGEVIFNENAAVQIDAQGAQVTIAQALAGLETYSYIKPVMPNYDELETDYTLLLELYNALGNDVWTGYGVNTGVISYKQGTEPNSFNASFMGGTYSFDLPFEAFTSVSKADNGDGTHTYTLVVNLPAQTGMSQETLHVTMNANGEITEMDSENAGIELQKETDGTIATWADLQNALNQGGVIKLTNDIVGGDAPLEIPAGKTVVLELNGFNINRALTSAVENGSVIINNGTLAIMGEGQITGGKTTGNGGGILNNGVLTLYGGTITGNVAALGGGVYNNGGEQGFWMTGGLIKGNTATSNPAIGGDVIFNDWAAVQVDADGTQVTIEQALADLATYSYIKPVMPNYEDIPTGETIVANNDPQNDGTFYSTFYNSANNYILPEGVAAYVADLSGSDLVLTRIAMAGQVIPADNAVILVSSVANYSMIKTNAVPVTFTANNDLEGVDEATPLTDIPGLTAQNCYVLSGTNEYGVGFYRINVGTLKAHKAYVKYAGLQNNAPKRMRFVFNQEQVVTGMENANADIKAEKILDNGVLYIIMNGVRYNVQGQIVNQ